jgi:hypothetical protein
VEIRINLPGARFLLEYLLNAVQFFSECSVLLSTRLLRTSLQLLVDSNSNLHSPWDSGSRNFLAAKPTGNACKSAQDCRRTSGGN